VSHRPALSQVARGARSFVTAALVLAQPVISALLLVPQPAHADVASSDIIFTRVDEPDHIVQIMKRSADGTTTPLAGNGSEGAIATQPEQPDVSHDGSRIVFMDPRPCLNNPSSLRATLITVNSDGSGENPLTSPNCPTNEGIGDSAPRWSPDGTQVAFSHQHDITPPYPDDPQYSTVIHKIDAATGDETALTTSGTEYDAPSWSPANDRVVYDSVNPSTGQFQLYIVNADGTNPHLLAGSNSGYADSHPIWSHDGNRIYFLSSQGYGNFRYYKSTDGFATTTNITREQISGSANPGVDADLSSNDSTIVYERPTGSSGCNQLWKLTKDPTANPEAWTSDQLTDTTCTEGVELVSNLTPSFVDNAWPTATAKSLVALGDSVAAGEGVNYGWVWRNGGWVKTGPDNPTWTDTSSAIKDPTTGLGVNLQQCHQSDQAYDRLLYADNYKVRNLACTGASALEQVVNGNATLNGGVLDQEMFNSAGSPDPAGGGTSSPPQLGGTCTGCGTPNSSLDFNTIDAVTLTVGANDIDFAGWAKKCYDPFQGDCDTTANTSTVTGELNTAKDNLRLALTELNRRASAVGKNVVVAVTNYYNPIPEGDSPHSCYDVTTPTTPGLPDAIGTRDSERSWMIDKLGTMNLNIATEVSYAQQNDSNLTVRLADISNVMAEHKWCSDVPWAYGPSLDFPIIDGEFAPDTNPAPFHPTPDGQRAIYQKVKAALVSNDYVSNGTFENGNTVGWNATNTPQVTTDQAHSGIHSMTFTGPFDVTDSPNGVSTQNADTVQADFWVKGTSGKTVHARFRQYLLGGNNELSTSLVMNGSWQHFVSTPLHLY
jgi:hypothetical protein